MAIARFHDLFGYGIVENFVGKFLLLSKEIPRLTLLALISRKACNKMKPRLEGVAKRSPRAMFFSHRQSVFNFKPFIGGGVLGFAIAIEKILMIVLNAATTKIRIE